MKTTTSLSEYVRQRDYVIGEIINNAKMAYPNDRKMVSDAIELTVRLQVSDPVPAFVDNLQGFMFWASQTNQDRGMSLATIFHDLNELDKVLNDPSFSPRTNGYDKYLTGATGLKL